MFSGEMFSGEMFSFFIYFYLSGLTPAPYLVTLFRHTQQELGMAMAIVLGIMLFVFVLYGFVAAAMGWEKF